MKSILIYKVFLDNFWIGDVGVLNANINNDFNQYIPRKTNCTLKFEPITVDTVSIESLVV